MTAVALPEAIVPRVARPRRFFVGAAVMMLLLVLLGFAPTFYLRAYFPTERPEAPTYVYWHGAVMTAWYLLLVAQTGLVSARRPDLHRLIGWVGLGLAAAVLATGLYVNTHLAARVSALGVELPPGTAQLVTRAVIGGLFLLTAFASFVIAAVCLRRRRAAHGRLMLLAFLATIGPAFGPGRWLAATLESLLPFGVGLGTLVISGFIVALGMYDFVSDRRLHPATLWGGTAVIAVSWASGLVADTQAAHDFVWLTWG